MFYILIFTSGIIFLIGKSRGWKEGSSSHAPKQTTSCTPSRQPSRLHSQMYTRSSKDNGQAQLGHLSAHSLFPSPNHLDSRSWKAQGCFPGLPCLRVATWHTAGNRTSVEFGCALGGKVLPLVTNIASVLNGNMMSGLQQLSCNHEVTGRKEWLMRTMEMPTQSPILLWSQQLGLLLWEGISHLLSHQNLGFQLLAAKSITDSISHPCLHSKTSSLIQH